MLRPLPGTLSLKFFELSRFTYSAQQTSTVKIHLGPMELEDLTERASAQLSEDAVKNLMEELNKILVPTDYSDQSRIGIK